MRIGFSFFRSRATNQKIPKNTIGLDFNKTSQLLKPLSKFTTPQSKLDSEIFSLQSTPNSTATQAEKADSFPRTEPTTPLFDRIILETRVITLEPKIKFLKSNPVINRQCEYKDCLDKQGILIFSCFRV